MENIRDMEEGLGLAAGCVLSGDADLLEILLLWLRVSLSATALACLIGLLLGALAAIAPRSRCRRGVLSGVNALMGRPPGSVSATGRITGSGARVIRISSTRTA